MGCEATYMKGMRSREPTRNLKRKGNRLPLLPCRSMGETELEFYRKLLSIYLAEGKEANYFLLDRLVVQGVVQPLTRLVFGACGISSNRECSFLLRARKNMKPAWALPLNRPKKSHHSETNRAATRYGPRRSKKEGSPCCYPVQSDQKNYGSGH